MKQKKVATLATSRLSSFSNHSTLMYTKGPFDLASAGNHYIYIVVDHFSNYIVTVPTPNLMLNML